MKIIIALILFSTAVFAQIEDIKKLPPRESLKVQYGHSLGGTLHSKKILTKRVLEKNTTDKKREK